MSWGFSQSDGKSKTAGIGTWKFYDSSGNIQVTLTSGGATGTAGGQDILMLMGG